MKPGAHKLAVFLLFFTGALALGWWTTPAARDSSSPGAPERSPTPAATFQPRAVVTHYTRWPVYLVVSGRAHDLDAVALALPTGTRFNLRATPDQSGELLIRARHEGDIDPTPLWRGWVGAGQTFTSPAFRVEGRLGTEELELTLLREGREVGHRHVSFVHR